MKMAELFPLKVNRLILNTQIYCYTLYLLFCLCRRAPAKSEDYRKTNKQTKKNLLPDSHSLKKGPFSTKSTLPSRHVHTVKILKKSGHVKLFP